MSNPFDLEEIDNSSEASYILAKWLDEMLPPRELEDYIRELDINLMEKLEEYFNEAK